MKKQVKTAVFFAHFDKKNKVAHYVMDYLDRLHDLGDVYLASDCDFTTELPEWVNVVHKGRHGEYDFGSWKRLFKKVDLSKYDRLIVANDSCFCLDDLAPLVDMSKKDFFGICETTQYSSGKLYRFIPSYFYVFEKQTFIALKAWFGLVEKYKDKKTLCENTEYELTRYLTGLGFEYDTQLGKVKAEDVYANTDWRPLLKRAIFDRNPCFVKNLDVVLRGIDYPISYYLREYDANERLLTLRLSGFNWIFINKYLLHVKGGYKTGFSKYRVLIKVFGIPVLSLKLPVDYLEDML
jgi:lipopolysaccharide biosynthesis protein